MCRQKKRVAKKGTEVGRILICFWWGACRPFGQTGYMGHREGAAMRFMGLRGKKPDSRAGWWGKSIVVFGPYCI